MQVEGLFLNKDFIYLLFRQRGKGGRKRGRETSMRVCLSCTPYWGPGLQPRHVPPLGIKPVTLWFSGPCSTHWAVPAGFFLNFLLLGYSDGLLVLRVPHGESTFVLHREKFASLLLGQTTLNVLQNHQSCCYSWC